MNVHPVALNIDLGPSRQCAMVLVQPADSLVLVRNQGYRVKRNARPQSLALLKKVCEISRSGICQDYQSAHFVVFPELSVTNEGLKYLETEYLPGPCPNNTIMLLGLEGVPWSEYETLISRSDNPNRQLNTNPGTVDWVNCFVVLVKDRAGNRGLYVQSKFQESRWEQRPGRIYRGDDLLLFSLKGNHGVDFNFVSFICSDFSAQQDGQTAVMNAIGELDRPEYRAALANLEIIFVLQHNKSLASEPFPMEIARVLDWSQPGRTLQRTALIFLNWASSNSVDDRYGDSAFFFHRGMWTQIGPAEDAHPWYKTPPGPHGCRQFRWRLKTPGVLTAHYLPINSVNMAAGAARLPLEHVNCYQIDRADVNRVGTSGLHIRWRYLLSKVAVQATQLAKFRTRAQTRKSQVMIDFENAMVQNAANCKDALLNDGTAEARLTEISQLLANRQEGVPVNYDCWTPLNQGIAMAHLLHVAALLKTIGVEPTFHTEARHSIVADGQFQCAILDGNDQLTHEQIADWYRYEFRDELWSQSTLLLITRPAHDPGWQKPEAWETDASGAMVKQPDEPYYFDPKPLLKIGFFGRLQGWQAMRDRQSAEGHIRGYLGQV